MQCKQERGDLQCTKPLTIGRNQWRSSVEADMGKSSDQWAALKPASGTKRASDDHTVHPDYHAGNS